MVLELLEPEVDLLVDGIQRQPGLLNGVHRFIEEHKLRAAGAGLRAVARLPGLRRRALIYRGDRALRTEDGIEVWPVATFLDALAAGELWP